MAYLQLRDVSKAFEKIPVVRDVSLSVEQGEQMGILGPSGSGKTTLLRLVAGLEKIHSGVIVFDSEIISSLDIHMPAEQRHLGMVFQSLGLWPHLSVFSHLDLVLRRVMPDRQERRNEILSLLEMAHLEDKINRLPSELSGGERQRLALMRALALKPRLLLLDEPFAHVDEPLRDEISEVLTRILRACNATSIVVSHDGPHLAAICDRIAVMIDGRVLQTGTFRDLYESPASTSAAQLTGPVFAFEGNAANGQARTAIGSIKIRSSDAAGEGTVLLRPEEIHLAREEATHRAQVIRSTFIAGRWRVYLQTAGQELWTWSEQAIPSGEEIGLHLGPSAFV